MITALAVAMSVVIVRSRSDEVWHSMPGGRLIHRDCISFMSDGAHLDRSSLSPCAHPPREVVQKESLTQTDSASKGKSLLGYYSDWSAYAQYAHPPGLGGMISDWVVPAKPTTRGPAPPLIASSVYIFNGLEDGGGKRGAASLILQPVLQFGKSGCLLDPFKFDDWYLTSYVVDGNGRAHCGKNIGPLTPGETVKGVMTLTNASSNTWRVDSTRLKTGEVSTYTVDLDDKVIDAAYLTLEGMVIYRCSAYPASGSVTFTNNTLLDRSGQAFEAPLWQTMIRHSECGQDIQVPDCMTVQIAWNTSA